MLILNFIKNFLIENPWKVIFSGLFVVSLVLSFTSDPIVDKHQLIQEFEYDGKKQSVYKSGHALRIKSCDGTCKYPQTGDVVIIRTPLLNILFGFIAAFLFLGILFTSIDHYNSWNIETIYEKSLIDCVKIYQEDDVYTYVLLGRILHTSKVNDWRKAKGQISDFIKNKSLFLKFKK